jgi:colicin import membrane protein
MNDARPPQKPAPAPGKRAAWVLAIAMHLLLAAFLIYGVHWQTAPRRLRSIGASRAGRPASATSPETAAGPETRAEPNLPLPPRRNPISRLKEPKTAAALKRRNYRRRSPRKAQTGPV